MKKNAATLYHPGDFAVCLPCAQALPISGNCPEPAPGVCSCCHRRHPQVVTFEVTRAWRPCSGTHHDVQVSKDEDGIAGPTLDQVVSAFSALPANRKVYYCLGVAAAACLVGLAIAGKDE